jgi:hypothetical protein
MTRRLKPAVAVVLSAAVALSGLPLTVFAQDKAKKDVSSPTSEVVSNARDVFLNKAGITEKNVSQYLIVNGKLTTRGEAVLVLLQQGNKTDPTGKWSAEQGQQFNDRMDVIRKSGVALPSEDVAKKYIAEFNDIARKSVSATNPDDLYRLRASIEAMFNGASPKTAAGKDSFNQSVFPDGYREIIDKSGNRILIDSNGVIRENDEIRKQQIKMNANCAAEAPRMSGSGQCVPVTGRYNVEMMAYPNWKLKEFIKTITKAYRQARMREMAAALGKELTDAQLDQDMERRLEREASLKTHEANGQKMTLLEYLDDIKFKGIEEHIRLASQGLLATQRDTQSIAQYWHAHPVLTQDVLTKQFNHIKGEQEKVENELRQAVLEFNNYQVQMFESILNPSSPDYQSNFREAIRATGLPDDLQRALEDKMRLELVPRHQAMAHALNDSLHQHKKNTYSDEMKKVVGASYAASQKQFTEFLGQSMIYYKTYQSAKASRVIKPWPMR